MAPKVLKTMKKPSSATTMKKPSAAGIMKKPSAPTSDGQLTEANLCQLQTKMQNMTIPEKMEYYVNNKKLNAEGNIDAFLGSLTDQDRQAVWKTFEYGRGKDPRAVADYENLCRGRGSDTRKKQALHAFMLANRDVKSAVYMHEVNTMTHSNTTREVQEWVPFKAILNKYGLAEAHRRLKKGTVQYRRDPEDQEEFQFLDCRSKTVQEDTLSHTHTARKEGKGDLQQWLTLKGFTESPLTPLGGQDGDEISKMLSLDKKKDTKAICDQGDAPEDDDRMQKMVQLADKISTCSKGTNVKVLDRIEQMLTVTNTMKGHLQCESMSAKTITKANYTKHADLLANIATKLTKALKTKNIAMESVKSLLTEASQTIQNAKGALTAQEK